MPPDAMNMPSDDIPAEAAALQRQAWVWLRLLTSGKATQDDADRFRRWLRGGPAHQAAYADAKREWDAMTARAESWRQQPAFLAASRGAPGRTRAAARLPRRAFLGGAAAAAAAVGAAAVYPPLGPWPSAAQWRADYRTATGEQRTLALARSVQVTLNTQTSVRRMDGRDEAAGMELVAGELAVDLLQAGRPFTVAAGLGRSAADAGQFEVRYLDGRVCVTCIEGAVRIAHPGGERLLAARQQAVYDARAISGTVGIDPASVAAWRRGMLVLHEMRLADAIDEINRYRAGRVILMNDAARDKRVNGSFPITALDQTLWQLQQVFDLKARAFGGVVVLS